MVARLVSGGSTAVTVEEAAVRTGISARTIDEWCRSGRLPSVQGRRPGLILVCLDDLMAFLAELAREADAAASDRALETNDRPRGVRGEGVWAGRDGLQEARREAALRESLGRHTARLHWIEELTLRLNGLSTAQEVADAVIAEVDGLVESDSARFYLIDEERRVCVRIAGRDRAPADDVPETYNVPIGVGITGWVAEHGVPMLLTDASRDPRTAWAGGAPEPFSGMAVPFTVEGSVRGVLVLVRAGAGRFQAEDLMALGVVASHVAQALRSAAAIEELARQRADLQRRLESQRLLLEIARQLASRAKPQEVLEQVAASLKQVVENDVLLVLRVDRVGGVLRPILGLYRDEGMRLASLPLDHGLTGWVVAHAEAAISNDAVNDERTAGLPGYDDEGAESLLVLPLVWDGEVAGTLNVTRFGEGRGFSEEELEIAQHFAALASMALRNAERYERVELQRAELERYFSSQRRLLDASEQLLLARDPRDVLDTLGASLRAVVSYDLLQVHRADPALGVQRPVFASDAYANVLVESEIPIDQGLGGWAIAHGEALLVNDAHLDPRMALPDEELPPPPQAVVAAPLFERGRVCGVLCVSRLGPDAVFSEREFELVKLFAAQASIALQNAEEYSAATARAERDSLTGLRNHGAFQDEIAELLSRGGPFALLMLDLDGFKAYNDAEGHPAGDEMLRGVARAMVSATREADGLYRYGGDEFAVLLPGATRQVAREVVKRIRRAVEAVEADGTAGGAGRRIGISAGIACHPCDGTTRDALVALADESLYHAKRANGR